MGRILALVLASSVALAAAGASSGFRRPLSGSREVAGLRRTGRPRERPGRARTCRDLRPGTVQGRGPGRCDRRRASTKPSTPRSESTRPPDTPLTITSGAARRSLTLGRDFYPLSILERAPDVAPPAAEDVPVVFAGYGISAPGLHYDDFAGIDVRGAAVLVFTHEPQEHDSPQRLRWPGSHAGRRRRRRKRAKRASGARGC